MSAKTDKISRRQFLSNSTKTATTILAATAVTTSCAQTAYAQTASSVKGKVIGANDRINLAIIGLNGRGGGLAKDFAEAKGVLIKTLCDIDERLFAERVKSITEVQKEEPKTEWDLRKVYDDKDIDAVVIATPNFWHALATIWACQAEKHVYVEKPSCYNVFEGRKMIEAARKYNCIVQVGFQNRTIMAVREAMKFLHEGKLGRIYMAKGLCYKPRDSFGKAPDSEVPSGVHYDQWIGPAEWYPFNEKKFHYNWHWHWNTGNGDIGNQGVHQLDIARWGLNKDEHPVKVRSTGGFYKWTDCTQETPNTQAATYEYADGTILQFEVRGLYTNADDGITIGNLFYGTEGWMRLDGSTWKTYFGRKNEPGPSSETNEPSADPMNLTGTGGSGHRDNFIHALRNGQQFLTCDIAVGHMSSCLPHLANISHRLGGHQLTFDSGKEKFVGNEQADQLLTRKYRNPYIVPEKV